MTTDRFLDEVTAGPEPVDATRLAELAHRLPRLAAGTDLAAARVDADRTGQSARNLGPGHRRPAAAEAPIVPR